jgi:hypothetical protein
MAVRAFNELNKQQQLAILIGVPTALAVVLIIFIYRGMGVLGPDRDDKLPGFLHRKTPTSLWAQIIELEDQIKVKDDIILRKAAVEKELADLKSDIKKAMDRLPQESEKADMRLLIEKLARDIPGDIGTVEIVSVVIVEDANRGRQGGSTAEIQTVTYQTELMGDLNGIIKYIDLIEKNERYMTVNSFSIRPGGVRVNAEQKLIHEKHQVKMSVGTYTYNPVQGGGR